MKKIIIIGFSWLFTTGIFAQTLGLPAILDSISVRNPMLKMYEAEARSMDEAAKGARSWMPPDFSAGFWMTPYNVKRWSAEADGMPGMGAIMVSAQQMLPNRKRQNADAAYMESMSSVPLENRKAARNQLIAEAKRNYYEWIIIQKKLRVLADNEQILKFMLQSAELRYRNGLEKISSYYKAQAALGTLENMRLMLEAEIEQKRFAINTLMNRDKTAALPLDTTFALRDYSNWTFTDTTFVANRSDLRAIDQSILVNQLKLQAEEARLLPEFGVRYDNMFAFGGQPMQFSLMGMVRIPFASWSSKMTKANVQSIRWQNEVLAQQKQAALNEAAGMAYRMQSEMTYQRRQLEVLEKNIIPALRRNLQTTQLAYEQNTEELFMLFDAWETLNMTQLDALDKLQQLLLLQTQLEEILEIQ
jgi:outer membrane protein TolC